MTQSMTISGCTELQAASVITSYMNEAKTLCVKINDETACTESRPYFLLLREDGQHLLVCQDACMAEAEMADEEKFCDDEPCYFSEKHYRVSPVYHLMRCRDCIVQSEKGTSGTVLPVLLMGSRIINPDDVKDVWKKMGVVVHTEQRGESPFSGIEIPVVDYQDIPELIKCYMEACREGRDVGGVLLNIDCKKEKMKYEVYCEVKVEKKPLPHLFDFSDDREDSDSFEMPEMPEGIDNPPSVEMLAPVDDPQGLLDGMVGMDKIKQDIMNMLTMSKYNALLRKNNSSARTHALSLHALFLGGPGTGKTTLARIYGSLLWKAGLLSSGHTVVCTRASFLGTRWGDEEAKTNIILELAKGGVLFIDEAYLLNTSHPTDPGRNVLQLMLPILADEEQRDIAIVLAGYTQPMQDLLNTNQGLGSRFSNRFDFQDLSFKELQSVSRLYIRKYNYHFTAKAWKEYSERLSQCLASSTPEWGNARFVHNMLDNMFQMHAMRCVRRCVSGKQLLSLTYEDVRNTSFPEVEKVEEKKEKVIQIAGFR